ncbi:LysM peptidoglycan-binding domain-containing protein [candidate division KSB1 bacterium]|nr:LysM peptidoglycan-binding domain-containing protein [candidate division KSB1 bacterium]
MHKKRITCGVVWVLLCIITGNLKAEELLFPSPPAVQRRVNFWVKAFTQYSKNHIILHDSEYPQVIYDVVDLNGSTVFEYFNKRARWQRVNSSRQEIRSVLRKLAALKEPVDVDQLSVREREVYLLWAHVSTPGKFVVAQRNLHAQQGLRGLFQTGLERSGRYLDTMKVIFREHGVPEDLCYLPHVESAFNYRAYSKRGAAGIWQFTRSTGRLFLKIDYSIDERYDPYLATVAAARLLRHNYEELDSWPLAITAYNHGTNGMKRAKEKLRTDDLGKIIEEYDGRAFGFASKNFYAEFLAAVHVARNHEAYFPDLQFEQPIKYQDFKVPNYVTLDALSRKFGIDKKVLAQLNPALRHPIQKSTRRIPRGYELRLPVAEGIDYDALYAQVSAAEKHDGQVVDKYYRVEPGDNLSSIARRFGTTVTTLAEMNNISNPRLLRAGQLLELPEYSRPTRLAGRTSEKVQETLGGGIKTTTPVPAAPQPAAVDTVVNLLSLARNHAGDDQTLYGPLPPITSANWDFVVEFDEPLQSEIIVQPEETLGHLAEWLNLPAQRLRNVNGLYYGEPLQLGQRLRVDFSRVSAAEFHRQRLEFHRSLQEDFFGNYRIDGTTAYAIKYGDSIWDLCNRVLDVPYWLLVRYNREIDFSRLQPGQQITVPVLSPLQESTIVNQEPA